MKKRILSLTLAVLLLLAVLPVTTLAAGYTVVIDLKYDDVLSFSEGLCAVKSGEKWGFIDKTGKEVIAFKYDNAYSFSEGLAPVCLNGKWGWIDKAGKEVIAPRYDAVEYFSEGLAAVCLGEKWGFIDKTGKEVVVPKYDVLWRSFSDGKAWVEDYDYGMMCIDKTGKVLATGWENYVSNDLYGLPVVENRPYDVKYNEDSDKYVFLDTKGKEIVLDYSEAWGFWSSLLEHRWQWEDNSTIYYAVENDAAIVRCANGKYGLVDKTGKEIINGKYDDIWYSGHKNVLITWRDDMCGLIDATGKELAPCKYAGIQGYAAFTYEHSAVYGFSEGMLPVEGANGKWDVIDTTGKEVIPCKYEYVGPFISGMAVVTDASLKSGYIDKTGKEYILDKYKWVHDFNSETGLAVVVNADGKEGLIDKSFKEIISCKYDGIDEFVDGLACVSVYDAGKDSTLYGYIDTTTGKEIVSCIHNNVYGFYEGYACVDKVSPTDPNKWLSGFVDMTGTVVVPLQYDGANVAVADDGLAAVKVGEKWGFIRINKPDPITTASSWAMEGINAAISKGFVPEDIQDNYRSIITREEFCRMALSFVEYKTGKSIDTILAEKGLTRDPSAFSDTSDSDILAAYALGITNGTGNGRFTPNGQFTREQAATMVRNTCKAAGMDVSNINSAGFTDISTASSWAVEGINFCFANGIMIGTGDNKFSPKAAYTREQSIMTFNNIK